METDQLFVPAFKDEYADFLNILGRIGAFKGYGRPNFQVIDNRLMIAEKLLKDGTFSQSLYDDVARIANNREKAEQHDWDEKDAKYVPEERALERLQEKRHSFRKTIAALSYILADLYSAISEGDYLNI